MTTVNNNLRWFEAEFEGGSCGACREPIKRSMRIAYKGYGNNRMLVGYDCCMGEGMDDESYVLPDSSEDDSLFADDDALRISNPKAVMPPGRTKADLCGRCFLIHTKAQGDECW